MSATSPPASVFAYFDNAATTPLDPEVLAAMLPFLSQHYGNPSSLPGPRRLLRVLLRELEPRRIRALNEKSVETRRRARVPKSRIVVNE